MTIQSLTGFEKAPTPEELLASVKEIAARHGTTLTDPVDRAWLSHANVDSQVLSLLVQTLALHEPRLKDLLYNYLVASKHEIVGPSDRLFYYAVGMHMAAKEIFRIFEEASDYLTSQE